jgi:hypothetical protein
VSKSYDSLVEIFECVENFLMRLNVYSKTPPTPAMTEMVTKIMTELITVLALATEQMKQGRLSMFALANNNHLLPCCREIRQKIVGREGD